MPEGANNREGPQARKPSKCLRGSSYGEGLAKEASCCPATRGSKKDCDRVNYCCGGSPCPCILGAAKICASQAAAPPSRFTLTGAELLRANKSLASMHTGSLWSYPTLCNPVDCGLPGFSVGVGVGVLQARILECVGQYWLPHPSRALYFLLP